MPIVHLGIQYRDRAEKGIYGTVLENIATGVISIDKNGDITTFNRAAEKSSIYVRKI